MQFKEGDVVSFVKSYPIGIRLETGYLGTVDIPIGITGKVKGSIHTRNFQGELIVCAICIELDNDFKGYSVVWIKEENLDCLEKV